MADHIVVGPDTGGPAQDTAKKRALRWIAQIRHDLDQLEETVRQIQEAPPEPPETGVTDPD